MDLSNFSSSIDATGFFDYISSDFENFGTKANDTDKGNEGCQTC